MSIESEIQKIFKGKVSALMKREATKKFTKAKLFIINAVRNHPICRELSDLSSPSQFLESSTSSLFGFMGFEAGSDPVGDLINYLEENISPKFSLSIGSLTLISSLSLPSKNKMRQDDSLKMPWLRGVSWPEAVENGVSGLKYFLGKEGQGRSELGIQAKVKGSGKRQVVRDADMEGVEFLSEIFAEAKRIG